MIVILHDLDSESGEHTTFEFYLSSSFWRMNFQINFNMHISKCSMRSRFWSKKIKTLLWTFQGINNNQRVAICAYLLAHHRLAHEQHRPFLSCIVTDDEKWCLYANIRKRKEWLSPNKRRICRKCSNFSTWHSIF